MEGFNRQVLDRLRDAVDDEIFAELTQDFVNDLVRLSAAIMDAYTRGDIAGLRDRGHELKGIAVLFGAAPLAKACTELMRVDGESAADLKATVGTTLALCDSARGLTDWQEWSVSPARSH